MKKDILYRKYTSKKGDTKIQLVVPTEMQEKVVSVAHDTLLAGHRIGLLSQNFWMLTPTI